MAGYSAAIKLNNLVISSFTTLGNGISNYTAQNLGAHRFDRIHAGQTAGLKIVWILCVPIVTLYFFFGNHMVSIFMDDPYGDAMAEGVRFLRIVAPFYLVVSAKLVTDGVLRGSGQMRQFIVATFSDLILRVVLAKLLSGAMGSVGIWLAWPVGWVVGTGLSLMYYKNAYVGKKEKSVEKDR